MKRLSLAAVCVAGLAVAALAAGEARAQAAAGWLTSLEAARAAAKQSNRPILADFTGSDWCPWCVRLKKEVFSTPEFGRWAAQNVVLLELDFPRSKQQSPALKAQNENLAKKYNVSGFPTVVFFEADGTEVGRSGYLEGGPAKWLEKADTILASRPKPEELKTAATLAEAVAGAKTETKPLLVLAPYSKGESAVKAAEALTAYPDFVRLSNKKLVTVVLKSAPAADSEEAKALAELAKQLKLSLPLPPVLLVDATGSKVLYQSPTVARADALTAALARSLPAPKYDGGWLEDFEAARAIAASLRRPMLLDFTGSDWCTWCKRLDAEVFGTDEFQKFAAQNLVLVKLDFPRQKQLSAELKRQNDALAAKFGVRGYPTVIVLSPDGAKRGQLGYQEGGPGPFIQAVKKAVLGG